MKLLNIDANEQLQINPLMLLIFILMISCLLLLLIIIIIDAQNQFGHNVAKTVRNLPFEVKETKTKTIEMMHSKSSISIMMSVVLIIIERPAADSYNY